MHRLAFDPYTKKDLPDIVKFHMKNATLEDDAMTLVCGRVSVLCDFVKKMEKPQIKIFWNEK